MTAKILDGHKVASAVLEEVREKVSGMGSPVCLATILVGDDPASQAYVRSKHRRAEEVGIKSVHYDLPSSASQAELESLIGQLNADASVNGILLQLPLPEGLRAQSAIMEIDPVKDVDGLHPTNLGMIVLDQPQLVPCTPAGCLRILDFYNIPIRGARVVVLGRSFLVGRPLSMLLAARGADATVTTAHSHTHDIAALASSAHIVVAAVGQPGMVTADFVRPGAAVIDVGINRLANGSLVGDADFDEVAKVAGFITPVPGGVGPMTVAMLMNNTLLAAHLQSNP